jgi:hypothetical protein
MGRVLATSLLALYLGLIASPARAKDDEKDRPTWDFAADVEQGYTDNVRWAADGPQKDPAWFTTIGGEATWHNERLKWLPSQIMGGVRGRVYTNYSDRDFAEIYTRMEKDLGDNTLLLRYKYIPEQLRLEDDPDEGATFSMDHELGVGAERKMGPGKRLRVRLMFEAEWDEATDGTASERDSFTAAGVGEVRYRLHDLFQPRLAGSYGVRDAKSSNYDRDEAYVEAGFVSRPWKPLEISFLYSWIWRDYTVGSATGPDGDNSNFDREDNADQFEVMLKLDVPRVDGLAVTLEYKYRDNDSTRDSREFDLNEGSLGLVYKFSLG